MLGTKLSSTAAFALLLSLPAEAAAPLTTTSTKPSFARFLEAETKSDRAIVSIWAKSLSTGEEINVRGDDVLDPMSVIKLAILVRAYQLADAGKLKLDDRIEIAPQSLVHGSGVFYMFDKGLRVTVRDVLTQMIITSDNSAT